MDVVFQRTGARRYAVIVEVAGRPPLAMNPAPGFDEHIPHDLVHYAVEAELRLNAGVFGRVASGGGTFVPAAHDAQSPRERARGWRRQLRREASLGAADAASRCDLAKSERLAGLCDLAWRRRHGQRPDPARSEPPERLPTDDAACIERVVARLDELARSWSQLPSGGALVFTWPSLVPRSIARAAP